MQIGFQPSSSPFRGSSVFRLCMRCTAHAVKSLEKFLLMTLLVLALFYTKLYITPEMTLKQKVMYCFPVFCWM